MNTFCEELKYGIELKECQEVIEAYYKRKEMDLYRWTHNPANDNDFEAQATNPENVPPIDLSTASDDEKLNVVGKYAISAYISEESGIVNYVEKRKERIDKKGGKESAGLKFDKSKGGFIQKFHVKVEDGLVSEANEDGHINFLEGKKFCWLSSIIGEPVKIM